MKTPYIIFSKSQLEQNYKTLASALSQLFPNFKICYSIKTNSFSQVIQTLRQSGSSFEAASLNELKLLTNNDFSVFNSPCKTPLEIRKAVQLSSIINIDSMSELKKIIKISKKLEIPIKLGLRISFSDSKFGISPDKFSEAIEILKQNNLSLVCISSHPGTQSSLNEYKKYLSDMKNFLSSIPESVSNQLKFINLGGGFPDKQQLKNLNLEIEYYLESISNTLNQFLKNKTLIIEPGRYLVSNTFTLYTKVHYIKENFSKTYAILDAGINILPKISLSQFIIKKVQAENTKQKNAPSTNYLLAGPLLFNNDIIGKFQGSLSEDDILKIENIGAYCYNLAWSVSYKKPKIVE